MTREDENKALVARLNDEAWGNGRLEVVDEILAPNFVAHPFGAVGAAFMKEDIGRFRGAFPDLKITNDLMVAEGDLVTVRATVSGTHRGALMGIAPTNKQVSFTEIGIYRVQDGRIVEGWGEMSMLGLMQQLGAVPPMGPP